MHNFHLNQAVRTLDGGGVIAYPTEAVFGLGCYPEDFDCVMKILSIKCRSVNKGLILVAANIEQTQSYVEYTNDAMLQKVSKTWPGAVTWVLPAKKNVPYWVTGKKATVAIRVSAHPIIQDLCMRIGVIISTSANPSGYRPASSAMKVRSYFGNMIDYIVPGQIGGDRLPTEIREATTGQILRASS